jgi:hypothetical protein
MKKLKVLYMSNNLVKEWVEFQKLVSKKKKERIYLTNKEFYC